MRHLKVEDVTYSTRPRTVFEESIWASLNGFPRDHPQFYQAWTMFLWSRQDEVIERSVFEDILVTDFDDHMEACIAAMSKFARQREFLKQLNDAWRFDFRERPFDREKLEAWKQNERI